MRKIIVYTFLTLDGVMQAPGGPEEDTSGVFTYGAPYVERLVEGRKGDAVWQS